MEQQNLESYFVSVDNESDDDRPNEVKKPEYIAFMCALHHINLDYLEDTLKEYDIGLYLIGAEVTPNSHKETQGQHFHFLVQMSDADYHKYSKRVFKDKFKLRGVAKDGNPRQYGRVKRIEDLERMAAYTIKDGNIRTNMSQKQLDTYKAITFKAKEQFTFEDELYQYLIDNSINPDTGNKIISFQQIAVQVVHFIRNYKVKQYINRNKIDRYVRFYQMYHLKDHLTDEQLVFQMF